LRSQNDGNEGSAVYADSQGGDYGDTRIPAWIDRLPWSAFHTRMVVALGLAWILDGLEITEASAVADTLTQQLGDPTTPVTASVSAQIPTAQRLALRTFSDADARSERC
jgi:hypothetical protein